MPLRIGQQVRCIDGVFLQKTLVWVRSVPIEGRVYTIRQIVPGYRGLGLRLVEIVNPKIPVIGLAEKIEPLFLASRFRSKQMADKVSVLSQARAS